MEWVRLTQPDARFELTRVNGNEGLTTGVQPLARACRGGTPPTGTHVPVGCNGMFGARTVALSRPSLVRSLMGHARPKDAHELEGVGCERPRSGRRVECRSIESRYQKAAR